MHTESLLVLLTFAAAAVSQTTLTARQPAVLRFCFNGGVADEDCITDRTLIDNTCERIPVLHASGKDVT